MSTIQALTQTQRGLSEGFPQVNTISASVISGLTSMFLGTMAARALPAGPARPLLPILAVASTAFGAQRVEDRTEEPLSTSLEATGNKNKTFEPSNYCDGGPDCQKHVAPSSLSKRAQESLPQSGDPTPTTGDLGNRSPTFNFAVENVNIPLDELKISLDPEVNSALKKVEDIAKQLYIQGFVTGLLTGISSVLLTGLTIGTCIWVRHHRRVRFRPTDSMIPLRSVVSGVTASLPTGPPSAV